MKKKHKEDLKFQRIAPIKRLLTVDECAFVLGISAQTIRNGLCRRTNKPFPIKPKRPFGKPMFDVRDIDRFLDSLPYEDQKG